MVGVVEDENDRGAAARQRSLEPGNDHTGEISLRRGQASKHRWLELLGPAENRDDVGKEQRRVVVRPGGREPGRRTIVFAQPLREGRGLAVPGGRSDQYERHFGRFAQERQQTLPDHETRAPTGVRPRRVILADEQMNLGPGRVRRRGPERGTCPTMGGIEAYSPTLKG